MKRWTAWLPRCSKCAACSVSLKYEVGMDDFYREVIIERYKSPQYRGELDPHDISFEDENPLCGDHIRIDLRVDENNKVTEAAFSGHGCAIS